MNTASTTRNVFRAWGAALAIAISASSLNTVAADCPLQWDATIGQPGFDGPVFALAEFQGALYAGGQFSMADGAPIGGIAKWDGSQWQEVGGGLRSHFNPSVFAMQVFDDGSGPALYVGGNFGFAGETEVKHIARWDGSEWSAVGNPDPARFWGPIYDFTVFDDGAGGGPALYAAGIFAGGVSKWTGAEWIMLNPPSTVWPLPGSAWPSWVRSIEAFQGGLHIGGSLEGMQKWEPGTGWSSTSGSGLHNVFSMVVFDDGSGEALYAAGLNNFADLVGVAKWNGATWQSVGSWGFFPPQVFAVAAFDDGSGGGLALYASGMFTWMTEDFQIETHSGVVKWNPASQTWQPLPGSVPQVWVLASFSACPGAAPMLYAGGDFTMAGGAPANKIARWGCVEATEPCILGDLDGNGVVNVFDLLILIGEWGPCANCDNCPADLDGNCNVNVFDLLILIGNWG